MLSRLIDRGIKIYTQILIRKIYAGLDFGRSKGFGFVQLLSSVLVSSFIWRMSKKGEKISVNIVTRHFSTYSLLNLYCGCNFRVKNQHEVSCITEKAHCVFLVCLQLVFLGAAQVEPK